MSRWPLVSLLVLAACPKKTAELVPPREPGVGCAPASLTYVATYVQPPEGEQGYAGWVLPLHHVKVDSVKGQPGFASIDDAAATAAGVPVKPSAMWLVPPGAPACKPKIGDYYAATIDGPVPQLTYGVQLTDCAAPAKDAPDDSALALASVAVPSACKVNVPRSVAARLGAIDQAGAWTPPTEETAIPAALAALVPAKECASPACEKLWSVASVDVDGTPIAYGAAVNWVTGGACPYTTEAWSGFFAPGADGALVKLTEGQDHPLALTHVLSDSQGRTILVAQGPGEYSTYELTGGEARLGTHVVWMVEDPEVYEAVDHLGPECPPPGAPAP